MVKWLEHTLQACHVECSHLPRLAAFREWHRRSPETVGPGGEPYESEFTLTFECLAIGHGP